MTRPRLEDFNPRVQAQIRDQLSKVGHPKTIKLTEAAPMLRQQSADPLNKLEKAFLAHLQATSGDTAILTQAITLKLANGVRYTPDFVAVHDSGFQHDSTFWLTKIVAYEVKGFMRDDAAVKLKVAASLFPFITFRLVCRKKGEWVFQDIVP